MLKRACMFVVFVFALVLFTPASKAQNVKGTNIPCNSTFDAMFACWIEDLSGLIPQPNPWADKGPCIGICAWINAPDSPYNDGPLSWEYATDDDYLKPYMDCADCMTMDPD
jgi:hypothetical protein